MKNKRKFQFIRAVYIRKLKPTVNKVNYEYEQSFKYLTLIIKKYAYNNNMTKQI